MRIQKCYELVNISISHGNRRLEYNDKLCMVSYLYKGIFKQIPISADRYWKALKKWHKLKYDNNLVAPTVHIEEIN